MRDFQNRLESLTREATDCELIAKLATDREKAASFQDVVRIILIVNEENEVVVHDRPALHTGEEVVELLVTDIAANNSLYCEFLHVRELHRLLHDLHIKQITP